MLHFVIFSCTAVPKLDSVFQFHLSTLGKGTITSLNLLSMPLLTQPRKTLAFFATKAYCWLASILLPAWVHRYFSAELLPCPSSSSLYHCRGSSFPRCGTLHLSLLNLVGFLSAHSSRALHSSSSTAPHYPQVISQLGELALHFLLLIIAKDVKQDRPLQYPTC